MGVRKVLIFGCSVLLLFSLALPGLAITPYDDVLVQRAMQNLQQENC